MEIQHERRMTQISAAWKARNREMSEGRKARGLESEIEVPNASTARAQEITEMIRKRTEEEAARKAEMEREPSE